MKQARIEWQGQVRDVLVNERDQKVPWTMARY